MIGPIMRENENGNQKIEMAAEDLNLGHKKTAPARSPALKRFNVGHSKKPPCLSSR